MSIDVSRIKTGVTRMFQVNFSLAEGESVLVMTDVTTPEQWSSLSLRTEEIESQLQRSLLARCIKEIGEKEFPKNQFSFFSFPATGVNGMEPPPVVGEKLLQSDIALVLTSFSITHTKARNTATSKGVRVASMPGFTTDMLYEDGAMSADYRSIAEKTIHIQNFLRTVSEVDISTESGTKFHFSIRGRPAFAETGLIEKYNKACNLPAGESACSPVEGSANGVLVIEKGWHRMTSDSPARLEVENGLITRIDGSKEFFDFFSKILGQEGTKDKLYLKRRNIAEFGIGTNPKAKRPDNVLEAEKIDGTIHIGYGNNYFMGGKVDADYHSDFVVPYPTVLFDGKVFMEKGKVLFPP